jgi:2-methylcitrate dehydratase PrpD
LTPRPLQAARHAVLDWTGVTLAARDEPLVDILLKDALANGEAGEACVVGRTEKLTSTFAALVNGAASHALDFDDVNGRVHGHPTVAILPAILAAVASRDATGADLLDALVVGTEVACAVGDMLGPAHYAQGFHATATVGTVSAAAAVARLLGLDEETTANALGLAATQAAGLKASFGTMAKPMHAGRAAMSGLLAARWAASGLTGATAGIEADQGFGRAMSPDFAPGFAAPGGAFGIECNCYKFFPACYYTHSAIVTTRTLAVQHGLRPDDVASVTAMLQPQHDKVCNIAAPQDGLGIKFSVRHLVAMALAGVDAGNPAVYTTEMAERPDLVALRGRVAFEAAPVSTRTAARIRMELVDGRTLDRSEDVGLPAADLCAQEDRLRTKFRSLAVPALGEARADALASAILTLDETITVTSLLETMRCGEGTP